MSDLQVKIIRLDAMRIVSFNGFGESPEGQALEKLHFWAEKNDLHGRVFGFNNPNPSVGSPNYGYEVWMAVNEDVQPEGEGQVVEFEGGLYAVLRCPVVRPWEDIPEAWQKLVSWLDASQYSHGAHQWLEEHIDPQNGQDGVEFTLDLYLPVRE